MKNCKFINELNRLRKSSSDSIDNVEKFDQFKSYMHVVRKMEEDLKGLLRKVNASGKKTLVLLCGSAGDGKSHLLSYLKNLDEEHLIDDYFVYNDATESSAPSKTAIETLNEFLSDYRDENLASLGQNVILAINLGVLSNFIDSKYADHFCTLRKYIENSDILTSRVNNNEYDCESNFQHISFSDYNLYSLSAEGIHADYIEKLLEKVFIADEENLFYKTYSKECLNCSLAKKCPVKLNYDYMKDKKRQRFVAELLVKTIIQDKMILTTREILNFIYDIIVSPRFMENQIIDDKIKIADLEQRYSEAVSKMNSATSELNKQVETYLSIAELKDKADRTKRYSNIALKIIERYEIELQKRKIDVLAETITNCYTKLANKKNLIKTIVMDPETLDLKYLSEEGIEIPKDSLSAGEQQLMVISILWALAICSKKKLPVIIDTPLSRLDSLHRTALITTYFPNAGEQTIILSTDSEIDENYYELMRENVGDEFTLKYDEDSKSTSIERGYLIGAKL